MSTAGKVSCTVSKAIGRLGQDFLAAVLLPFVVVSGASAATKDKLPISDLAVLQYLLVWTGDYIGIVDGVGGPLTAAAIRQYHERSARQPSNPGTGAESAPDWAENLIADAIDALAMFDFVLFRDNEIDVTYGVPRSLFQPPQRISRKNTVGLSFRSPDGAIELEVLRLTDRKQTLSDLYSRLSRLKNRTVTYRVFKDRGFIISGNEGPRDFYARFELGEGEISGFSFSYDRSWSEDLARVAVGMSNVFRATTSANDPLIAFIEGLQADMEAAARGEGESGGPSDATDSSGSGFVVDGSGRIVSNAHVVEDCREIRIGNRGVGRLIVVDKQNDLALLESSSARGLPAMVFRSDAIKLGEEVIAGGYPLLGILADSLNITVGVISSLSGLGNDSRFLQTTAAIQPGNSGGPLVDRNGRVVGIVTSKLGAQAMLEETGFVPEGVNFAIRHDQVRSFLEANGVIHQVSPVTLEPQSVQEVVEVIQKSIVPIICLAN